MRLFPVSSFYQFRNSFFLVLFVISQFSINPEKSHGADWPTYQRNNSRTGSTLEGSLQVPLTPIWKLNAPAAPQPANTGPGSRIMEGKDLEARITYDDVFHVAVVGERVYFGSSVDHQLHCVDAGSGREIWSFFAGAAIRLAPTVANGKVYFGSDDGYAYCLDATKGTLIWKLRAGPAEEWMIARQQMISRWPIRTGILVEEGIAYFGAGIFPHENVYLYAVDAEDGSIIWKNDQISQTSATRDDLTPQGYWLINDKSIIVPSGRNLPVAIDRKTGKLQYKRTFSWRSTAGGVVGGTRALLVDGQIFSFGAHHILAMSQKDGNIGYGWLAGHEFTVVGDAAYSADGNRITGLDRKKYAAATVVRHNIETKIYSMNRSLRGKKGEAAKKTRTEIAELNKKKNATNDEGINWKIDSPHQGSLLAVGDHLFAGGENILVAYNRNDGKQVWSTSMDGTVRGLAVANGQLYASTTTGQIACFANSGQSVVSLADNTNVSPFPQDDLTERYEKAAQDILKQFGAKRGFCLVVGNEQGRLAYELAKRSDLHLLCVEPDAKKVAQARKVLSAANLYGTRITIHQSELSQLPYSNYFANLIVSDSMLIKGTIPGEPHDVARHLKPVGGKIILTSSTDQAVKWLQDTGLDNQSSLKTEGTYTVLTRGKLPGAGSWSHQYGEAGNSACSDDQLIKGGLGVLWSGDPGEEAMVNRHEGAVGPLSINGRLFIQGEDTIMAYDAYNGMFLWKRSNPEAIRTGVFFNNSPGNLVASDDSLYYMSGEKAFRLDAATGKTIATYELPEGMREKHQWGYISYQNGILFGTATVREVIERKLRRRGKAANDNTDSIFAIDTKTGKLLWVYQGKSIQHQTIAVGPKQVYFIDSSITSEQRAELLRQDKTELQSLTGKAREIAEDRAKKADLRLTVAVDIKTGKKAWAVPVDVTDCSDIGIGGGRLTLMYHNDMLLLCGANANGHYWQQFMAGEFSRRRLVALSAKDGYKAWAKDGNYRSRPIIVGNQVLAEPWSYDLETGDQKTRKHPLTGKQVPWSIMRSGHHCGMISATQNMLLFRSGFTGFYDLEKDSGTQHFAGHRTGCWINSIAANGLVMIPESSAGCVCLFSISSTIVLEPREPRNNWSIISSVGKVSPVQKMALNLGAPGDRVSSNGTVWLSYPRPRPSRATSLDLPLNIKLKFQSQGKYNTVNTRANPMKGTDSDWLYTSQALGFSRCELPLIGKGEKPGVYNLRLHFAELDSNVTKAGQRVFDVSIQGKKVLTGIDIFAQSGGLHTALIEEINDVSVTDNLIIELTSQSSGNSKSLPAVLSAIEVIRVSAE